MWGMGWTPPEKPPNRRFCTQCEVFGDYEEPFECWVCGSGAFLVDKFLSWANRSDGVFID